MNFLRQFSCKAIASGVPQLALANGGNIPMVGFGTAFFENGMRLPENAVRNLRLALEQGYTHIDTASMYGCERQVGLVLAQALMSGNTTREQLFVTTKAGHPPTQDYVNAPTQWLYDPELSAYQGVKDMLYQSLQDLGLGYVDMLLLHWPGMFDLPDRFAPDFTFSPVSPELAAEKRRDMWRACEDLYAQGVVRAVGVSNFHIKHLESLAEASVSPMMNQIEIHPYLQQHDLVDYCQGRNIALTAYCPLGSGALDILTNPTVVEIANSKNVSPGEFVLAWLMQRKICVIPKSSNPVRMCTNLLSHEVLQQCSLSVEEMAQMTALDQSLRVCADPSSIL
jgi:diketogulonate reductase-like aldo/keto reductase